MPFGQTPVAGVPKILQQELGITEAEIIHLSPLNSSGWAINSSFSNQKLYGFVTKIDSTVSISKELLGGVYPTTKLGIHNLLENLSFLQCPALLLEWQIQTFYS
ncbi:hypothetical protein ACP6PL_25650 [Dapis sp. BLCC M126]|uniref:hypothetical protein n=1 Tax=Dapis sp. BLCC M126 TaxID=3400189 RepID=UPI003CEEC3CD